MIIRKINVEEASIKQYICNTAQNAETIIKSMIETIYQSQNYQDFSNLESEIEHIETLKQAFELYCLYISKDEKEKIQQEITKLKFDALYRKQVGELIYQNGGNDSNLTKYDSKIEKDIFNQLLNEKINSIKLLFMDSYENDMTQREDVSTIPENSTQQQTEVDEIFKTSTDQILSNSTMLERLIIMDMKKNPYNYMNLLKANVFNAHLCNIGNNPFEEEIYLTADQLEAIVMHWDSLNYNKTTRWGSK